MWYIVAMVAGVIFGFVVRGVMKDYSGDIIVTQDEDGTYLSLNVDRVTDITSKKEVTLRVRTHK